MISQALLDRVIAVSTERNSSAENPVEYIVLHLDCSWWQFPKKKTLAFPRSITNVEKFGENRYCYTSVSSAAFVDTLNMVRDHLRRNVD